MLEILENSRVKLLFERLYLQQALIQKTLLFFCYRMTSQIFTTHVLQYRKSSIYLIGNVNFIFVVDTNGRW